MISKNPPSEAWARIRAQLPSEPAPPATLWQNLVFWRRFALASGALAIVCIGALVYFAGLAREPLRVAELNGDGKHALVATIDPGRSTVLAVPASLAVTGNRVPELWLIVPGKDPRSLGLVDPHKPVVLAMPRRLLADATSEAALGISLEPPGGSPTGQPSGGLVAVGPITRP